MAAGRLDVLLGLDAAEFTSGLTKAELDAEKFRRSMVKLGADLGKAVGLGLTAAVAGIAALTKASIDAADHLNDLSRSTGLAVETIGGIGFAASQAGSDLDGVANAFGKFNLRVAEAARGEKEAAAAFKAMGIAVKDAAGNTRAADAIFKDVATAFSGYADGAEKAAIGNAIFGKSYQTLLPLLADGGRSLQDNIDYYQRFGGVTTETAQAADQFNDTLGKISLVTGQLGRELANQLLPPLQVVADEFLKFAEADNSFKVIAAAARTAFETIAIIGANVVFVFQGVGREIAAIAAQLTALVNRDFSGFRAISDAVKEDGQRARAELDGLEKRILGLAAGPSLASSIGIANPDRALSRLNRGPASAPALPGPDLKKNKQQIDENAQAFARYVEQLASGLEKEEQLSRVQEVTRAIEQNRFGQLIPQQRELLLLLAQQVDAQDEYARKIAHNAELERQGNAERERFQQRLNDLTGRSARRQDIADLKMLDEALQAGTISLEEFAAGQRRIAGFSDEVRETGDAARELGMTFTSAFEDAFVEGNKLRDVFDGLMKDILRITTRKLVTEPFADLFSDFAKGLGASSSGGGWMQALMSSLFGGGGQNLVGVFAGGEDFVQRDGLAMVHRGERIVTAEDNRRGSSGATFHITNQWPAGTTTETASQAGAAFARKLNTWNTRNN